MAHGRLPQHFDAMISMDTQMRMPSRSHDYLWMVVVKVLELAQHFLFGHGSKYAFCHHVRIQWRRTMQCSS